MDFSNLKYVALPNKSEGERTRLEVGDVLVSITADLGIVGYVRTNFDKNAYINQHIALIRFDSRVFSNFIAYFMASDMGNAQFQRANDAGAKKGLNLDSIRKFQILLPPLPEQRRIAATLSQWDDSLSILAKLIEAKRQQKRGLAEQLLTGKRRLKGFEGEWPETKLGEMGTIVSGGTPATNQPEYWDGDIPWVTPGEITKLETAFINHTARRITHAGIKSSSAILLPSNSLVVCTRATVGYCAINTVSMATNQGFKNIIPNDSFCTAFLYYLISSMRDDFLRVASGSTFLEVSKAAFENLSRPIPLLAEQQAIAAILSALDEEITTLGTLKAKLQEQKRGLMDLLLTGKVQVKVDELQVTE